VLDDVVNVLRKAVDVFAEVFLQQRVVFLIDLAERPSGLIRERRLLGIEFQFLDQLGKFFLGELGPLGEHLGAFLLAPVDQHAFQAADDDDGQDDVLVLVRLELAAQPLGRFPDCRSMKEARLSSFSFHHGFVGTAKTLRAYGQEQRRNDQSFPNLTRFHGALTRCACDFQLGSQVTLQGTADMIRSVITAHADVVGSLLRPPELLAAQKRLATGAITAEQFKAIEDRAVDAAIALQEGAGLEIVTDGEMRRRSFQSQMTAAVSGFGEFDLDAFLWGEWHDEHSVKKTRRPRRLGAVARLERLHYLSADEFSFLKGKTARIPRSRSPAPACGPISGRRNFLGRPTRPSMFSSPISSKSCATKWRSWSAAAPLTFRSTRPIMAFCSIPRRALSTRDWVGAWIDGSRSASNWITP
jgi:hypothetical protein